MNNELPLDILELVGDVVIVDGNVFGRNKVYPETEFNCLKVRKSHSHILNIKTKQRRHGFEMLLKNDDMPRARWSLTFPYGDPYED